MSDTTTRKGRERSLSISSTASQKSVTKLSDYDAIIKRLESIKVRERDLRVEINDISGVRAGSSKDRPLVDSSSGADAKSSKVGADSDAADSHSEIVSTLSKTTEVVVNDVRNLCDRLKGKISEKMSVAEQVSSTVRRLHLAQTRAENAATYVGSLLDLNQCVEDLEKAMVQGKLNVAKAKIEWYLSVQSILPPEHRVRCEEGDDVKTMQGSEQRSRIMKCRETLINELRQTLREIMAAPSSADRGATADVCASLTLLGDAGTVQSQMGDFLRRQLMQTTEVELTVARQQTPDASAGSEERRAMLGAQARKHEQALSKLLNKADQLTREYIERPQQRRNVASGDAKVEPSDCVTPSERAQDRVFRQQRLVDLHEECDVQATRIIESYIKCRQLRTRAQEVPKLDLEEISDAVLADLDLVLDEMAVMAQHTESYIRFIRGTAQRLSLEYAADDEEDDGSVFEAISRAAKLKIAVQEMAGIFILFDSVFMRAGIQRAKRLEEVTSGSPAYSSAVEDIFFLMQKCSSRAVATGHGDIACAVFHSVNSSLEQDLLSLFVPRINSISPRQTVDHQLRRTTDAGVVAANSMDVASDFCFKLHESLEKEVIEIWPLTSATTGDEGADDAASATKTSSAGGRRRRKSANTPSSSVRRKLGACLQELHSSAKSFQKSAATCITALCNVMQLRGLIESIIPSLRYDLDDKEYEVRRGSNKFAQVFLATLQQILTRLTESLTENNARSMARRAATFMSSKLIRQMMRKRFNQLGALQLDGDVRLLLAVFRGFIGRATSRRCLQRLSQFVALLNIESPNDAPDMALEIRSQNWMITDDQVRRVLSLRSDFSPESVRNIRFPAAGDDE